MGANVDADDDAVYAALVADLERRFVVEQSDNTLVVRPRWNEALSVRTLASKHDIAQYVRALGPAAGDVLGIEPEWLAGAALAAVHLEEEAAMLLDPPDGSTPPSTQTLKLNPNGFARA